MTTLWRVATLRPPYADLTYGAPEYLDGLLAPGMRVLMPLKTSTACGVLLAQEEESPGEHKLRNLLWPLEREPLFGATALGLAATLAERQLLPVGQVLTHMLPPGLRTAQVVFTVSGFDFPPRLTPVELGKLPAQDAERAALLWQKGRMEVRSRQRHKPQETLSLAVDPPWPLRPGALRQAQVLDHLFDHGPCPRSVLLGALGPKAGQALRTLLEKGLVRAGESSAVERESCEPETICELKGGCLAHTPTAQQRAALDELFSLLDAALAGGGMRQALLHGVTGSGKTLVYLSLARRCLEAGRGVLLLAPEIALACALGQAAREALPGAQVLVAHGSQSPKAKEEQTLRLARAHASGEPLVLVGTRSALLGPLPRLGLIVLDEEHDESFKQDERLVYQAKELAWYAAQRESALLVLGSATPDVKTAHAARGGSLTRVELAGRVNENPLPPVEIVDLRLVPGDSPLAPPTREALAEVLERGEQAILMLNRRGYAPVMHCTGCGTTLKCPHCDVGLTFHKARQRLMCHYCALSFDFPRPCDVCGGTTFVPLGDGTEKLEEQLSMLLPDTGVLRLDRDAARRPEVMHQVLRDFGAGKAQVLVGTQMLSKGHHFPDVTLVAVVDADLGLNLPDYRAPERTFQLLTQVAGRAGRGDKPGRVLLQTRAPEHPFWGLVQAADYQAFYQREMELRQRFSYPPFVKLGLIRASYPQDLPQGPDWLVRVANRVAAAGSQLDVQVLGPAPAPLARLRGRLRFNCVLKGRDWGAVRGVYAHVKPLAKPGDKVRLALDLDPVSTL